MYQDVLPYLRCPGCLDAVLELESGVRIAADGAIVQGCLRCTLCARRYPIKCGVLDLSDPRLLPHTPTQFINYLPPTAWLYERLWRPRALTMLSGEQFGYERELPLITGLIAAERGGLYLDLACSNGLYARALDHVLPHGHVVGIDHSLPMLYQARTYAIRRGQRISFVCASAQALPLATDVLSGVAIGGSLNEIGDVAGCLRETRRVLAASGRCVLMSLVRSEQVVGRVVQNVLNSAGVMFWSPDELQHLLQASGLRLVSQWQYGLVLFSLVVPA